jgi:hypothetical protein
VSSTPDGRRNNIQDKTVAGYDRRRTTEQHRMMVLILFTAGLVAQFVVAEDEAPEVRFLSAGSGSVSDTQTGLFWTASDNRADIDWSKSNGYCNDLVLDSSSDWRLSTLDNLKSIFDWRAYGPPLSVKLSGSSTWSADTDGSESAFFFDFNAGSERSLPLETTDNLRVICIRGSEVEKVDPDS